MINEYRMLLFNWSSFERCEIFGTIFRESETFYISNNLKFFYFILNFSFPKKKKKKKKQQKVV